MAIENITYGSTAYNNPLPAHQNKWGWEQLDNMRVNAGILDILKTESFVFRFFYDPNIEVKGDIATWFAKQPNRRVKYRDSIDYKDFKTSISLKANLELIEFGCYGDVYSRDFGSLAIGDTKKLEEFIELHQKNSMNELNHDILRKFKEDIHNDDNFPVAPRGITTNPESFYESGTTNGKDNAEIVWDSIYTQSIRMCRRSHLYNAASKNVNLADKQNEWVWSNVASPKDMILMLTPKIYSMIVSKLYAGSVNSDVIRMEPIFGGVAILDFSDHEFSSDTFDTATGASTAYGKWYDSEDHIVMMGKDAYKICDAINPPLFIDNSRIGISMKTYFFKWFFGFCGFIKFINACKWKGTKKTV